MHLIKNLEVNHNKEEAG